MKFQPYEKYKESDIEWLGQVPQSWIVTKLKRYGKFKGGSGFPIEYQGYENLEIPFYKVNSLAKDIKYLIKSPDTISIETSENLGAFRFPVNSIFFAKVGAALLLSRIRKNLEVCCIDNNMMGFIPNSNLDSDFAYYLLQQIKFDFLVNSGAIPSVNDSQISRYQLVFPSLDEQINIANYLNKETFRIDNLISKQEQLIKLLEEQRKSIISHAVIKGLNPDAPMKDSGVEWLGKIPEHWEIKPIKSLYSRVKRTGFENETLLSVYREYGVIVKSSRDDNHNKESDDLSPYQLVNVGDLVINKMKAWQGSLAISEHRGIVSPAYYIYEPFESHELNNKFIHNQIRSQYFIQSYKNYSKGIRVGQWDLESDLFVRINLYIPPADEQNEIVNYIQSETNKINNLIDKQKLLIEKLKEYRTSIISHAVTGKIDVREAL